jgi:hypothetical protein
MVSEPLDSLVAGWKRHFAAADATIRWGGASERLELELAPGVWLVGELDAWGHNAQGELFFGEWKTANPREKRTWKQVWRMNPQSLSYGVLAAARWPGMERFTVRKAFKETVPTYDHAWFKYEQTELVNWTIELNRIASEIRAYKQGQFGDSTFIPAEPWPTNWKRCFMYGPNYACPFFETACNKQNWAAIPSGAANGGDPTWSATQQRERIQATDPDAIVLSPTTVADWFDCREMYRRKYVELVTPAKGDALLLGGQFHDALSEYYSTLASACRGLASAIGLPEMEVTHGT